MTQFHPWGDAKPPALNVAVPRVWQLYCSLLQAYSTKKEKLMDYVYVLDTSGKPLMPTTRYGNVRRMLRDGLAKVKYSIPFTIQLLYEPETKETQRLLYGNDPGRTNIGAAVVRENGVCVYQAHCTTRNKEIPGLMRDRAGHRRASRNGERKKRLRRAGR